MGVRFSFFCLILLLLVLTCHLSPPRRSGGNSKKSNRNADKFSNRPKPNPRPSPIPGQLSFGGKRLNLQINHTEESEFYAANYSRFPDALQYPWLAQSNSSADIEEYLINCLNTTMEMNKAWISRLGSEDDIYMRVAMHVLRFLCLDNYGKSPNRAELCSGGLWVITIVLLISYVLQELG